MPLTADNFIQENSGTVIDNASIGVSLPSGTTAGNTVFVFIYAGAPVTAATGFTIDRFQGSMYATRKPAVTSETSWTFTQSLAVDAAWYAVEMSEIDVAGPYDTGTGTSATVSNGGTRSTGTTTMSAGLSTVAFAMFGVPKNGAADAQSWDGWTNGFTELAEVVPAGIGLQLAVACAFVEGTTSTFETTATYTSDAATVTAVCQVVVHHSSDSAISVPLEMFAGFEWGTHGGMGTGGITSLMTGVLGAGGTWGSQYLIQAGSARNSSYGLRVTTSSAAAYIPVGNFVLSTVSFGANVRVVSATGVVRVAILDSNASDVHLVYDASTNKYGVRFGTGTVTYQSGTTALNTWVWVDIRARTNSTTHHVEWRIETAADTYTEQTAVDLAGQSATATIQGIILGGEPAISQTATTDFDDMVYSRHYAAYPLGPHEVRLVTVDTGGTPTVSGTTTNFSVFTANGTLAAWNATNARNALDDAPPTISASADGVVQTAVAASDYMQFPMATYACASNEVVAAVRALFPEWGGTGTGTGTIGYRGWDGTTETTFVAASASYDADSLTAASGTYPLWKCAMWPSTNGWTQAELDAAALRVGFSTDATPDMGIHAAYLEVAIRPTPVYRQITAGEADEFTVDLRVHPYNSATVSYLIGSTHASLGATFSYSISGTPQTPVVVAASTTEEVVVNAAAFGEISDVSLEPDAV